MQAGKRERRQLGLPAATAVVTGEAIALGIFLTPAAMAKSLGSPLLLGLVWLGVAFILCVYFFPSGIVGRLRSKR